MKTIKKDPRYYRRNLPHWQPEKGSFFVTARLSGSLPKEAIKVLKDRHELAKKELKSKGLKKAALNQALKSSYDLYFGKFDHLLDDADSGPTWLAETPISNIVKNAFHHFDNERYKLVCYTIMSNHVHLVLSDLNKPLFRVMQSLKRYTSRESNKVLDRIGKPFWQEESFDRLIRNGEEFLARIIYTLENPVKAGLVNHWKEWPYNYLKAELEPFFL